MSSQRTPSPAGSAADQEYDVDYRQLLQEKPVNRSKLLEQAPLLSSNPEYCSVILNQLAILLHTATEKNWETNHDQIRYILDTETENYPEILSNFLCKLVTFAAAQIIERAFPTGLDHLLQQELDHFALDCTYIEFLTDSFIKAFDPENSSFESDKFFDFLDRYRIDIVLKFVLLSTVAPSGPRIESFFEENAAKIPLAVLEKTTPSDKSWCHVLLGCILQSPTYPFLHKLSTIAHFNAFDSTIPPVQQFFRTILNMTFKDLLMEIGPDNLLPEQLLPSLLMIKADDAHDSIALILAEVLIPGSQGLSTSNGGVTALTMVNNLPEANAKGAQLQAGLKAIDENPSLNLNWFNIFPKMKELLQDASKRNSQPSLASVTQLFSSLDFKKGLIDIFLSHEWWFEKTLLYMFQSMYTQQGAFDILNLRNLELCYEDEVNSEPQLLKFINIAKLEVKVMAKINAQSSQQNKLQSEADQKLDSWLTQFFELHCRSEPHHIIAGALAIQDTSGFILDRIDRLFAFMIERPFVENLGQLEKVMRQFKESDPQMVIAKLIEFYTTRLTTEALSKVMSVAYTFYLLDPLLIKARSMTFSLYWTFLIEALNHGYDVKERINADLKSQKSKENVLLALLDALESRANQDFSASQQNGSQTTTSLKPLGVFVVHLLLDLLKGSPGVVDPERLKALQLLLLTTYPRLINFGTGHDEAIFANEDAHSNSFPPQVEQEMKTLYSKMYNKEIEIKEIVDMLTRMKVSDVPHDQDVFACMIHSLIDEYRFFAEYPLTALASTSLLFGALLQKDLIQGTTLTVALNFIWESCNQPQDSHMFKFAIQSLYNFKSRLHEYPMYCKHLLKCQSLPAHAKMYQIVKDASAGIPCLDTTASQAPTSTENQQSSRLETAVQYNSVAAVRKVVGTVAQEDPSESVSDKLLFFVNNMTTENMNAKLGDVSALLSEKYFSWFAHYLVTERAKTEPNNHALYSNLVFALKNSIFYEYVLNTTLFEVEKLLRGFKDTSTERLHLKNLGSWLGKITLANDRPLKRDQVALKYLLVEAFDFRTLHIVIPFVCKILEQASQSKIFKLPNPWVLGIMKVLVELYDCADLKLNLKFEIEVLLNAFDRKVKDIEPSTLVRSHNPKPEALAAMFGVRTAPANYPDLSTLSLEGSKHNLQMQQHLQQQAALMQQQQQQLQQQQQQQQQTQFQQVPQMRQSEDQAAQAPFANQLDASFGNLNGSSIFTQNPNFRRAFQASLARAVRECAVPILSRVSEAVLTTTEALVKKDFATIGDVSVFRNAYQTMAQQLAHGMVMCSGRKILSETIEATILQILGNQLGPNDLADLNLAIQNNVDLCVEIVENLAASNISELIEERMRPHVLKREQNPATKPYMDEEVSSYALSLPPPLGLRTRNLLDSLVNIYTEFGSNSSLNRSEQMPLSQPPQSSPPGSLRSKQAVQPPALGLSKQASGFRPTETRDANAQSQDLMGEASLTPHQNASAMYSDNSNADQLFFHITQMCDKAIQLLTTTKETSLSELEPEHQILQSLSRALSLCQANALKFPELLLKVAQYAVNCLFTQTHENPMSNEIYVVMLDKLCETSPPTAKDVTWWMVHSVDERKFNMPVILSLLKVQLVAPLKLDSSVGKLIAESNSPVLVTFAASLLLNVFSSETRRPIALRSEFACTLDALLNYVPEDTAEHKKADELRNELLDMLNKSSAPELAPPEESVSTEYTQMGYIFVEWVKLLGHSEVDLGLQNAFIDKLFHCGILTEVSKFQLFFKSATEIATTAFVTEHEVRSRTQTETLLSADCLATLIVRIILKFNRSRTEEAMDYLKNIFGVIVSVMANEHESSKSTWNERAYFKIFSSLMCMWCDASIYNEHATTHFDLGFYSLLGDMLNSIQPLVYPGFTFAWISLIAHRMFLPKILELPNQSGYSIAVRLLSSLLRFQTAYSKDKFVHHDVINVIFKAINRVFAALAHDKPEFLASCHFQLVTSVPSSYIQVKNVILSAVPNAESHPSPFIKDLKFEDIPATSQLPGIFHAPVDDLSKMGLKKPVENFLRIPTQALMRSIYGGTKLNYPKEVSNFGFDTVQFSVKGINAIVLHVGISACEDYSPKDHDIFNAKSSHAALMIDLLNQGSTEFRYHILDAAVNQLRYPNLHTQWFTKLLLHVFNTTSIWAPDVHQELQEILVRVVLERHIVNKPHPWGLSYFLTRLLNGEEQKFFSLPFVKEAGPELKGLFETLARATKE